MVRPQPVRCTLWVHDTNSTKEDVIINWDLFPKNEIQVGNLAEVVAVDVGHGGRDLGEGHEKPAKRFLFIVGKPSSDVKIKKPNLQISLSSDIANAFGFKNFMQVEVTMVDKDTVTASHVELAIRDEYLSRSDMWRLVMSELHDKAVYKGQKLLFLGTIKARVTHVYHEGKRVPSAHFGPSTKPIFRSESARYVLFVQMCQEMWEFDITGSGEIYFDKMILGFLPDLFKRWHEKKAHHLVSVVLFARMYDDEKKDPTNYNDYYRVVVSETASLAWGAMLQDLKKEFRVFWRDLAMHSTRRVSDAGGSNKLVLRRPCPAKTGNILEALSLASSQFSMENVDRDLVRTGLSIVIITGGTGIFLVPYDLLISTTEMLTSNGMGIDLVCLSPPPLHSVPVFQVKVPGEKYPEPGFHPDGTFTTEQNQYTYAVPTWVDVSYWESEANIAMGIRRGFMPQAKMYSLQMMGIMENEMDNIALPYLPPGHQVQARGEPRQGYSPFAKMSRDLPITKEEQERFQWMDDYDEEVFRPVGMSKPRKRDSPPKPRAEAPVPERRAPLRLPFHVASQGPLKAEASTGFTAEHVTSGGHRENATKPQKEERSQPIPIKQAEKGKERAETPRGRVDVLQAASIVKQAGPKLDLSNTPEVTKTLSPKSALSPWLISVNPWKPSASQTKGLGRWQHIYPHPSRMSDVKWKSLCTPAVVPLTTECFPTAAQLASEYHESPYTITHESELLRELVALRLAHGFQFVVGKAVAKAVACPALKDLNVFDPGFLTTDGAMVVMSLGNTIHQIQRLGGGDVEVKRFVRKPTADASGDSLYNMFMRTSLAEDYEPQQVMLRTRRDEYNWNYVDSYLAGDHAFDDQLRFWRARFVLIPVEQPAATTHSAEDNEEEIRIEGIRKFTQVLQRYRQGEKRKGQDANPLDIIYQTRDPSAVVAAELDPLLETDSTQRRLIDEDRFRRANLDLQRLAQQIQGDRGVRMEDRRWHLRLHYNCFIGSEMTTWLMENFSDVETREEAVELGNELMQKGFFVHVERRHAYRDGHMFYQLGDEYRHESRRGWFGRKEKSVPSTPSASKDAAPMRVVLSKVLLYDVDHRKRSDRPEFVSLSYDRLHNPDNCYHIRLDWMNVTGKLIEDAVVSWATMVNKYGLKLVEVPIREASAVNEVNPLRAPYLVRLAQAPPSGAEVVFDGESLGPHTKTDPQFYQKAILRRFGYVLDMEAAKNFPSNVEVVYSWGKPDYRYTQYIHRSGLVLAQITDTGDFLLLANRLYTPMDKIEEDRRGMISPLVRAHDSTERLTPEDIKDKLEQFCGDAEGLKRFYDTKETGPVANLGESIPSFGLPPASPSVGPLEKK
ncbi:MAG: hypothetical protein M1823_004593 [Watsoniomyces obsoletus]|nr:MAG: hypothetical protein M1823_004593 [Watsoniomyces obsoletus]